MMHIKEIMEFLPHRYPFLLVDRVLEVEKGKSIVGYKNVSINEPFFNGHFPNHPVMPGVLIVEAMAQLSGILGFVTVDRKPSDGVVHYLAPARCASSGLLCQGINCGWSRSLYPVNMESGNLTAVRWLTEKWPASRRL